MPEQITSSPLQRPRHRSGGAGLKGPSRIGNSCMAASSRRLRVSYRSLPEIRKYRLDHPFEIRCVDGMGTADAYGMRPVLLQWRHHHALPEQGLHDEMVGGYPERGHDLLSEAVSSTKQFVTDIEGGMRPLALRRILNEVTYSAVSFHQHDIASSEVAVQSRRVIRAFRKPGYDISSEELQYRIYPSRPKPAKIRPPCDLHHRPSSTRPRSR